MNERPIRVMQIVSRLNVGGPAVYSTLLTEKLSAPHYESRLVCGVIDDGGGDMAYFAEQHGIQPVYIPRFGQSLNPLWNLAALKKMTRIIREFQPDVVHTHTAKAGFIGRLAAWRAGVPVIVHTFHGHVFEGYFNWPVTRLFILLEQFAARLSDAIITLTVGLRRELADTYHITRKGRITVLPLGLDLNTFASTPRRMGAFRSAWNIPVDSPLIGIVGWLLPVKNHSLFLDAAAQIRAKMPAARFVIVGDGETRPQLEAQVEALGLRDAVIFTGWQREVAPVYSDLDVLVNSSLNEGTPAPVIEALAAGCPVVAAAVGGLPDLLDHGALGKLTAVGDATALAEAILQTLAAPPDMTHAQTVMFSRYNIDRLIQDMDSLYRGLLAKKGRSQPRS